MLPTRGEAVLVESTSMTWGSVVMKAKGRRAVPTTTDVNRCTVAVGCSHRGRGLESPATDQRRVTHFGWIPDGAAARSRSLRAPGQGPAQVDAGEEHPA